MPPRQGGSHGQAPLQQTGTHDAGSAPQAHTVQLLNRLEPGSTASGSPRRPRGRFVLDDIPVEVVADDVLVVDGIKDRTRPLCNFSPGPPQIVFDVRGPGARLESLERPEGRPRRVYDAAGGGFDYFDDADLLFVDYADALRLRCDPRRGHVEVAIDRAAPGRMLAINPLLTITLLEVAKRLGRFGVHAACVARGGRGVLIAGPSGAGKSTLAVALVRAGFDFLSDDIVFLRHGEHDQNRVRVIGFPDTVDMTAATLEMFPELADLRDAPLPDGRPKQCVRIEERFGAAVLASCAPHALVLVGLASDERSALVPAAKNDALVALAPNVLLTDETSSQAHFGALAALVRQVPCYSLRNGHDLAQTVRMIAGLFD